MRLHQRSQLDDTRVQLKSAPASLHSNYFRELHGPSKENASMGRNKAAVVSKHNKNLRQKSHATKAFADGPAMPYGWQDILAKRPANSDVKADTWSCPASFRGPLYSLSCNSQIQPNNANVTPRAPRIPSKLDALRKQMASAPAARPGPANLHSSCYDYLYKKEGSHKPPKLNEKALRLIDQKLEEADTLGPCYYGQGIRRERSRVRPLTGGGRDAFCKEDAPATRTARHRRLASCNGNLSITALGGRDFGTTAIHDREHKILREFHPRNYRLRSDIDIRRRKQSSAPTGNSGQTMEFYNCPCDCQARERGHNLMHSRKTVNFKELKDNLRSRYEGIRMGPSTGTSARNSSSSLKVSRKVENNDHVFSSACQSSCSHECESSSSLSSRKRNHEIAAAAADRGHHSNYIPSPPFTAAAAHVAVPGFGDCTRTTIDKKVRSNESSWLHSKDHHHRPQPNNTASPCSEEAAVEESHQIRNERLDKSLQRQKMMLGLIRKTKERNCKLTNFQTPSPRLP